MVRKSEEKMLAGIAHLGILFNLAGMIGALAIFLLYKDKSSYVADHAKQALGYQITVAILSFASSLFVAGGMLGGMMLGRPTMPVAGFSLFGILMLAIFGYAVYAAFQGFLGNRFHYMIIGEFIDRI